MFIQILSILLTLSPQGPAADAAALSDRIERDYQKPNLKRNAQEERKLYSQALKTIAAESWDEALLRMEHFVRYFPTSDLADNAIYWMAQIYMRKSERGLAMAELQRLIRDYPSSDRSEQAARLMDKLHKNSSGGNHE